MNDVNTDAYRTADLELRTRRDEWRRKEVTLLAARDSALRKMIGTQRGGVTNAAKALEVSDAQILRLLDEGITRAVRQALDGIVERTEYQLTHQRGGRSIGIVLLTESAPSEDMIITALAQSGLHLTGRRLVNTTTTGTLRWKALKATKSAAQSALSKAGIAQGAYRISERRGDHVVRLELTPVMEVVAEPARERLGVVLRNAGLVVQNGNDPGELFVSAPSVEDDSAQELLFTWTG